MFLLIVLSIVKGTGDGSVGGFWWSLHFNWITIPNRIRSAQKTRIDPYPYVLYCRFCLILMSLRRKTVFILYFCFRSPTMAGGLLAAHREYFFEIGGYGKYII